MSTVTWMKNGVTVTATRQFLIYIYSRLFIIQLHQNLINLSIPWSRDHGNGLTPGCLPRLKYVSVCINAATGLHTFIHVYTIAICWDDAWKSPSKVTHHLCIYVNVVSIINTYRRVAFMLKSWLWVPARTALFQDNKQEGSLVAYPAKIGREVFQVV